MKLRIIDRIIAAIAGLMLAALSVIPLADTLFDVGILDRLAKIAAFKSATHIAFMVGGGVAVLLVGLMCLHMAVRRPKRQGFVVQTTDVGELSISIRAIDDLVSKCVEKHEELHVTNTTLENTRDGLVIGLRIGLASGVNIPLAVSALQKQIKQYVTACSGVDVHEVKVQVDATSTKAKPSIYAVSEILENPAPLAKEETQTPDVDEEPDEAKEPEEKCLHQRLFSEEEQPAIVPAPPVEEAVEEIAEEVENVPADAETEAWESNVPSDEAVEAWEKKVPADEIIEAWEKAEEEAAEAAVANELDTLSGLTDEGDDATDDLPEEAECVADEESVAELAALDGAEEAELAAEGEEKQEEAE